MEKGQQGIYSWIEGDNLTIEGVLTVVPDLVIGRRILITSFDSGPLALTQREILRGSKREGDIAVSPPIDDLEAIPYDQYDEWRWDSI